VKLGQLQHDAARGKSRRAHEPGQVFAPHPLIREGARGKVHEEAARRQLARRAQVGLQGRDLEVHQRIRARGRGKGVAGAVEPGTIGQPQERFVADDRVAPQRLDRLEHRAELVPPREEERDGQCGRGRAGRSGRHVVLQRHSPHRSSRVGTVGGPHDAGMTTVRLTPARWSPKPLTLSGGGR
jgi:hypothetical protein